MNSEGEASSGPSCTIKHEKHFVDCDSQVVYCIPLTCGMRYVGQTGGCVNKRLEEHDN